jgi:hypothetical protein
MAVIKFLLDKAQKEGEVLETEKIIDVMDGLADVIMGPADGSHSSAQEALDWLNEKPLTDLQLAYLGASAKMWESVMERVAAIAAATAEARQAREVVDKLKDVLEKAGSDDPKEIAKHMPEGWTVIDATSGPKMAPQGEGELGPLPDDLLKILRGPDAKKPDGGDPN